MTMSPDELRALAEALAAIYTPDPKVANTLDSAEAYLRACADAQPVAYRQWDDDEGYWYYGDASCAEKDDELLYTHPAPAAPHPAVRAGWQLVPVKPTLSMNSAGLSAVNQYGKRLVWETYKAMLAAAPVAPQAMEDANVWKQIVPDDAPQAEPKREALSDTMVIACARVAIARIQPDEWVATDADLIDFARAIESEHGIGGSDAGAD